MSLAVVGAIVPATPALAAPSVYIWPDIGPVGTSVSLNVEGFTTFGAYNIRFDSAGSATNQIAFTVNGDGDGWKDFDIPANLYGGSHTIYVVRNGTNTATVSGTFTVTPRITSISPTTAKVGSSITVAGDGFSRGKTLSEFVGNVTIDGNYLTSANLTGTTNANGVLTGFSVKVPTTTRGIHTIGITDPDSGEYISRTFSVESELTITPTTGKAGDTLTLVGTGFAGGTVNFFFDNQLVGSPVTVPSTGTNAGNFTTTIVVPATTAAGTHTISARDGQSVDATFTINQQITVSPITNVSVGDTITVTGGGFRVSQPITISLDGASVHSTVSDATGAFSTTFTLPETTKGSHTIQAQAGTDSPSSAAIVVIEKLTNMSPKSGPAGSVITISGTGFTPGTANVTLGGKNIGSITVGNNGSFTNATVTIPTDTISGEYAVAVGGIEGKPVESFTFTVDPKVVVNPTAATPDDIVTITGSGFTPQSSLAFSIGDSAGNRYSLNTIPAKVNTLADGSFSATFKIPNLPQGQYSIRATEENSGKSGEDQLTINPTISQLSSDSGNAGDSVAILGTGFAASKQISITFGGQTVVTTPAIVRTNEFGWFDAYFTIPAMPAGDIAITASDGIDSASETFTLERTLAVDPATTNTDLGWVGMNINITGTGFKASAPVTVTFDTNTAHAANGTTNAQGSFSLDFRIPPLVAGSHKMKISDGTTTQELDFYMEGTSPAVPLLESPLTATKPKQPVSFSWGAVSDPSGVVYDFQLSQDITFANLILSIPDMTDTSITLPANQELPSANSKAPYMWRVRAIDGAGNASEWSPVNTFTTGFSWPSWLIHVWYSLGILIALAFGVWFGRRMAYQAY